MEREMCFICGTTISRGNRSEVNQSKMDKLVSVQRTVDHSSTIICDILSRILNETVMGEENVCRLCFNLLNDIDYHLKEAQEKTDEITAKFLDKEKDPLRYNPERVNYIFCVFLFDFLFFKLLDPRRGSRKEKTRGGSKQQISPGVVTRTIQTELGPASVRPRSPSHVPVKGGGKGQSFFKSPDRMKSPKKKHSPGKGGLGGGGGGDESDDEMSEKKRRLLSRVLAPTTKRGRHPSSGGEEGEEERRLTIDMEEEMIRKIRKKEKKMKRREKRRRQLAELEQAGRVEEQAVRLRETVKREEKSIIVPEPEDHHHHDNSDLDNDYIQDISEPEDNTSAQYSSPTKSKSEDIQTVDLSQLGDLFSQEYPQQTSSSSSSQVFAKKSIPTTSSQQQVLQQQQLQQQQQQHQQQQQQPQQQQPVYIVQEPGVTSITLHPGQSFPIIDCRNIVSEAVMAPSQAAVVVDSPLLGPEVSTPADVTPAVVTKSPASAAKTKTEGENSKKVGGAAAGVPNVPCPHCDKKFMRGYNMRVHIERVHNKSKPWQCQFCEKTFATTSDLKQHLSSHGMGKIHKCEDCGREFTNRDSAILHRKQHNNERTHWCQDCGKGFFKASCLQRHMRSHTGEKPYHCEFCNRGFSQVTTLKNHKKVCKAAEKTIGEAEFTIDDADVKPN